MGIVAKGMRAGAKAGGKKLTKKKRPNKTSKKEVERLLDLEKAKAALKKLRAQTRAKEAAEKKKVNTKASTQKGMIGSGARSLPKGQTRKEAEPMRAMSDDITGKEAVSTGQAGRINTGKSFTLQSMQSASQRKRAKEFARIDSKDAKDRTDAEKKFFKQYRLEEIDRSMRAASASSKTLRAKNKNPKLELPSLKGEKKTSRSKNDAGDPVTGEYTSKTTANRINQLGNNADARARVALVEEKTKRTRARNTRTMKKGRK